jgi:hypothetical protein
LRLARRKRYKEMSGFDVLVEYLPGARMSFRRPADGVEGPEYMVMDTGWIMARPADLDAGEITDKGYLNQRQVLANRAALVELLYIEPVPAGVVVAGRTA